MATLEDFLIENIGSKFGQAIGTGQAGTLNPEIAKILANITQPSQPNQGNTLEDFALPPASGLFGRPINFSPTTSTPSSSGISAGGVAGPAIAGTLSAIIDALSKGQQPGGQQPGQLPQPGDNTGVNDPNTTGLGEGEDLQINPFPIDPGSFQAPASSGSTFPEGTGGISFPSTGGGGIVDGVSQFGDGSSYGTRLPVATYTLAAPVNA